MGKYMQKTNFKLRFQQVNIYTRKKLNLAFNG